jgi:hypothetical protein
MACYALTFTFTFKYVDDPEMSQTTAAMNTEMRSTRAIWAAKVYKVFHDAKNTMHWRRAT